MASRGQGAGTSGEPASAGPAGTPGAVPPGGTSPAAAHERAAEGDFARRPELYVGAAFAGGIALAQILRRLGR